MDGSPPDAHTKQPPPATEARTLLHRRAIEILGHAREDGLYDIEATLADTKAYAFATRDRGTIEPGEKLHGMRLTLTIDEDLLVHACRASTEWAPYVGCHEVTPNFARMEGVRIGAGWNKAVRERLGGVAGCTHLSELLAQMATVAFQTLAPVRRRRDAMASQAAASGVASRDPGPTSGSASETPAEQERTVFRNIGGAPALLDTCWSYRRNGPVVQVRWPEHYTGSAEPDEGTANPKRPRATTTSDVPGGRPKE